MIGSIVRWLKRTLSFEDPSVSLQDPSAWRAVFGGSDSDAGESITTAKAITYSPVWQCVKMISGDVSKLSLEVFRRLDGDHAKTPWTDHDAYLRISINGRANDETSAVEFWRRFMVSALLFENGYAWIERDSHGNLLGLYNLLPDRTAPMRYKGQTWYVTEVNGKLEPLHFDDVLHVRGLNWDGQQAPELIQQARHDIGLALAARKFTSKFFSSGAHLGGILQVPPGFKKPARDKIERGLAEQHSSSEKAFKTLVLRDGYRWFSTTVDPEKAQTVPINEATARSVAQWFNVPPARIGIKDSISYNSFEQSTQVYYDSCLSYWLIGVRAECNLKLISSADWIARRAFIDYNINALLWADAKTRNEIATAGIQSGRFSPDETRAWENLNPRPDGQGGVFWRPANMNVDAVVRAHRGLLAATAHRLGRRWEVHREREAKRGPDSLAAWLRDLPASTRDVSREMFGEIIPSINSTLDRTLDPDQLATRFTHSAIAAMSSGQDVDWQRLCNTFATEALA